MSFTTLTHSSICINETTVVTYKSLVIGRVSCSTVSQLVKQLQVRLDNLQKKGLRLHRRQRLPKAYTKSLHSSVYARVDAADKDHFL